MISCNSFKMIIAVAILFSLCFIAEACAGWVAKVAPEDDRFAPGRAVIMFSPEAQEGKATFGEALQQLVQDGHVQRLELVSLHWFIRQNEQFQRELFSILEQSAPLELAEAKQSAGNMRNPKMVALGEPFKSAVSATQVVQEIVRELESVGRRISEVEHEKLMLVRDKGHQRFDCFLYLFIVKR